MGVPRLLSTDAGLLSDVRAEGALEDSVGLGEPAGSLSLAGSPSLAGSLSLADSLSLAGTMALLLATGDASELGGADDGEDGTESTTSNDSAIDRVASSLSRSPDSSRTV